METPKDVAWTATGPGGGGLAAVETRSDAGSFLSRLRDLVEADEGYAGDTPEDRGRARRDGASEHGEPIHQQLRPPLGVLRRQPSRPRQRRQPVQGRPEHLGEQRRMDPVAGDLAEALQ
jgi:hypothetical protein